MSMTTPDCTDHGSLSLDYVRGRLSDAEGRNAEVILSDCPHCRAWINREFSGPAFDVIDHAVGDVFDTVSLPTRRQRFGWIATAAAIVVVAGGLTLLNLPHSSTPTAIDQLNDDASTRIVTFDFEDGVAGVSVISTGPAIEENRLAAEVDEADALFTDDLENGGTGSWTVHT